MANRRRSNFVATRFSNEEMNIFTEKMQQAGIKSKDTYLRKMALNGYIVRFDTTEARELVRLIANISSNVNQIAKRANESRSVYASDVQDLHMQVHNLKTEAIEAVKIYRKAQRFLNQ